MMTPENFAEAINRSMAEVRAAMQETAERLEAEFRRFAAAAGVDERAASERMKAGNEQLREMVDSLRIEASRAAGEVSEGMNEMMAEFRRLLEATMPGWGDGQASPPAEPTAPASPEPEPVAAAAKKTAKKSTKKATKKSTKKATKKAAKKAAKKSTKKATKKAAKKTAKKTTKTSTKKAAKKSAKKTAKKAR